MRALFWNIRGFGRRGRRTLLKDYLRLHKIDIVCLQETIKQDFSEQELRSLEVGDKFFWCWLPANGHSGGMLLGLRDSVFDVGRVALGQFFISASILCRADNFKFEFIGVYGPADHAFTQVFLQEISARVAASDLPILMGGDFNLLRDAADKNNDRVNWARMDLFNDNIASWGLREIPRTGARYTWTNKRLNPVRCVLDRVLIAPELDIHFPLCSLMAETSLGSDHTPLILDSGQDLQCASNRFFFESGWMELPNFADMFAAIWGELAAKVRGRDVLDWWNFMSGGVRKKLKGWNANRKVEANAVKAALLQQIKDLDQKADSLGLDGEEWAFRYHLEDQILAIFRDEEEYWRQRGRVRWLLQGDSNTAYFHAVANGRRRKCCILRLLTDNGPISEKRQIQEHIYDFYRRLLGSTDTRVCSLDPGAWGVEDRVSTQENEEVMRTYSQEELDILVQEMKSDTAPGPDGLPVQFFKKFWPLIRMGVLHIINDFLLGRIDISRLNFGVLSLIPKVQGADHISQFRPIALINVIFKMVSKAVATKLDPIANRVISPNQTAFIKGRFILDGILALHEVVHEVKANREACILLKLDFEKAYDRVNWDFLREVLRCKGFDSGVVHRLMQLVSGGQTAISINGEVGPFFRNKRGVRQGDPLSPLLFNFMAEALSVILTKANSAGHIAGVVPNLIPGGITHLQYADDTIIMIQDDDQHITNLKFILMCFEDMSGLKINYHKSEVIIMGRSVERQQLVADQLNCKLGEFPFIYLGLPISDRALTMEQWLFLVRKLAAKVEPWWGKFMSSGGRLILSNACLANLPTYAMGLFLLQDGIHAKFDSHRARFYWEGVGPKRKFHLVNWPAVCRPKDCGGLGIVNSRLMNVALLLKWVWKLYQDGNQLWRQLINAKYPSADDIFTASGQRGSQFWRSLHKIKHLFKLGAKHSIRNGRRTRFWMDRWVGDAPIKDRFPGLFSIAYSQMDSVAQVCGSNEPLRFRRQLDQMSTRALEELQAVIVSTVLVEGPDKVSWRFESDGRFSVKSMYARLAQGATVAHFKDVWAAKVPLKIRIFSWQLVLDRLPSSANIQSRHGPGNGNCSLCGERETADHIFFTCPLAMFAWSVLRQILQCSWCPASFPQFFAIVSNFAGRARRTIWSLFLAQSWALWLIRNKLTMESKLIRHPADIIFKTLFCLQQWLILAKPLDRPWLRWLISELRRVHALHRPDDS
jgi:exonuclease III